MPHRGEQQRFFGGKAIALRFGNCQNVTAEDFAKTMKQSVHLPAHTGDQPIRVLKHNVLDNLLRVHLGADSDLLRSVQEKGLKQDFAYVIDNSPIINASDPENSLIPFVDADKRITLHETFLSYVWSLSFAIVVLTDFNHKVIFAHHGMSQDYDMPTVKAADSLFGYGASLIREHFVPWDKDRLPNPEFFDEANEPFVGLANGVFANAMAFILSHELGHVFRGHIDEMNRANAAQIYITTHERVTEEIEADRFAVESMLQNVSNEQQRINRGMGVIVGVMSLLLLKSGLTTPKYPDIDERIESALNALQLGPNDGLWIAAITAIRLWQDHYKKGTEVAQPMTLETAKDVFDHLLAEVRREK